MWIPPLSRFQNQTISGRFAFVLLLCATLSFFLIPQPPTRAQKSDGRRPSQGPAPAEVIIDDDDVLKFDTDLVLVDVAVTDASGRPVRGLRAKDFKLFEDGEELPVAFVNVERRGGERPVAVVFAVDVSGSMTPEEMLRLQAALEAFSEKLSHRPATFALMSFGMGAKIHQGFTSDARKLRKGLERLAREMGGLSTHTYDAVDDAIRMLVRAAPRTRERRLVKRAVVVITDGFPVGDIVSPATVIERANAAEVSIYSVTLPSHSHLLASAAAKREPLPTPLDVSGLVEKTGGTGVYATEKDYEPLFKSLAEEVSSTYVLAFYPPEEKRYDGRVHTIRVEGPPKLVLRQNRNSYKSREK